MSLARWSRLSQYSPASWVYVALSQLVGLGGKACSRGRFCRPRVDLLAQGPVFH